MDAVERRIAEAIERGELDPGPLRGRRIPDIDHARRPGWWAEQFVRRERSRLVREVAVDEQTAWSRRFARAGDLPALRRLVEDANRWVVTVNRRMLPADALAPFRHDDIERAWRAQRAR